MEDERVELVKAGCLGTCWYGKYHYIEPWVGCGFDCAYCYARSRSAVTGKMQELGNVFSKPALLLKADELARVLARKVREENVQIAKLCRFTDILNPEMVENGASLEVLKTLVDAGVGRIIITTKGVPDRKIIEFMSANKDRFSYNFVAKPETGVKLEGKIPPVEERFAAAGQIKDAGIQVTVHVDPIVPGIEDEEDVFAAFLLTLKKKGFNRVMFSYLLLNDEIIATIKERFGAQVIERLLELFESEARQMLPGQAETTSLLYKPELKTRSVERIFGLLASGGFEYVLCSLKSGKGNLNLDKDQRRLCDGTFYA